MNRRAHSALRDDESGLSLIEIIVAMMILTIVAVGVAYSLANILTITKDSRSRAVAANLAAQYIDKARSFEDIFQFVESGDANEPVGPLNEPVDSPVIDGTQYFVFVDAKWDTNDSSDTQCGATVGGDAPLRYKRINVTVSWEGMRPGTSPVRSDTIIAPNSRINSPTAGSIVIQVTSEIGAGQSGITSNTTVGSPANGASPVEAQGLPTDASGCSYVLNVVPGTYNVTVNKSGYVDTSQAATTSAAAVVTVVAGGTTLAPFVFDDGALITSTYPGGAMIPTNLTSTFSTTYGEKSLSGNPVRVFPFGSGYQIIAGNLRDGLCKSPDPGAWPVRGDGAVSVRPDPVTVAPGSAASIPVGMGLVTVSKAGLNNSYITAVMETNGLNGDPGCSTQSPVGGANYVKYTFSKPGSNTATLALPYGTYKLYFSGNTVGSTPTGSSGVLTGTPFHADGTPSGLPASQTVTLDPRLIP